MVKPNVAKIVKDVQRSVTDHAPEVLTTLGIAGMIGTTILAVQATPKAMRLIEAKKKEKGEDLTKAEVVKTTWKCYVPATVSGLTSIACLIGASSVNAKRNAALATAYKLTETAFNEYRDKVVETIGDEQEKVIKEKVNEERLKKDPVSKKEVIITNKGDTLCYDYYAGRYFKSDMDKIKTAMNELSRELLVNDCVSLNDWYDLIDLDHTPVGDMLGWRLDFVGKDLLEPAFGSHIAEDGTPCLVVDFSVAPRHDFSKYS